jgi:hypothetical protein
LESEGIDSVNEVWTVTGYAGEFRMVTPQPKSDRFAVQVPGAMAMSSADFPEDVFDDPDQPVLIDGEEDLTEVFRGCIESSGYFLPEPEFDVAEEEITKQQIAEVSNEWAKCARDNGIPDVVDAKVTIDNWETQPAVVVPASTNLAVFQAVLDKCPPVNPETDPTIGDAIDGGTPLFDPAIAFEPSDDPAAQQLQDALDEWVVSYFEHARSG